jgi:hypothetical protein
MFEGEAGSSADGRWSAALVGPRPRGRPAAFRHIRQQRHLACALDRDRDLSLMPATRTSHPTVSDLASLGQVSPQLVDILVVDFSHLVLAQEARLSRERLRLSGTRARRTRSALTVFARSRLRGHAPSLQWSCFATVSYPAARPHDNHDRDGGSAGRAVRPAPTRRVGSRLGSLMDRPSYAVSDGRPIRAVTSVEPRVRERGRKCWAFGTKPTDARVAASACEVAAVDGEDRAGDE